VTAHQLFLTEMDIDGFNSDCHVIPPLRTQRDQQALINGLRDNTIDAIVSDHQPHDADAKLAPFAETEAGISAVETYLSLALKLSEQSSINLFDIISKLTTEPANVLGLNCGSLEQGSDADICLLNPEKVWQVDKTKFNSHGKNTPFNGWELKGKVIHTLVNGKLMFSMTEKNSL
jgi:dihydroorotase